MPSRAVHPRPAVALAAVLVAGAVGLGGCGGGAGGVADGTATSAPSGGATPTAPAGTPAEAGGTLTVSVSDGGTGTRTWTLTCGPDGAPGGDHPDPAGACAALAAVEQPFAPVPPDRMCTQVYGGPETATVTGRWRGQDVQAAFKRTDGCEIARWNRLAALLQPGGAAGGSPGGG
ncbi:SSI family serine proteinase inhibitor [Kineococcus glutinatus]|uniref:Subtilisin inhibitor domain-containing protein n=1 Tax=Kineococcus glutinatus TaxID=1070872 RepID=A0ABP8VGB5_9ACTN